MAFCDCFEQMRKQYLVQQSGRLGQDRFWLQKTGRCDLSRDKWVKNPVISIVSRNLGVRLSPDTLDGAKAVPEVEMD
jgi:hypothetical protein